MQYEFTSLRSAIDLVCRECTRIGPPKPDRAAQIRECRYANCTLWLVRPHQALPDDRPKDEMAMSMSETAAKYVPMNLLPASHITFRLGQRVRKKSGGAWHGAVVGWYRTALTPEGYAVESAYEPGSVQIYPASALEPWNAA